MEKVPRRSAVSSAGWAGWGSDAGSRSWHPGRRLPRRRKNLVPGDSG